jgi:hypothetical protein
VLAYNGVMSTDTTEAPIQTCAADADGRRAKIAPLLAAGLNIRAISAETGIPVGAVHRAKRQIEKAMAGKAGQQAVVPLEPPPSLLVQRVVDGVRQDVRQLTISVYERAVSKAVGRGLLDHGDRDEPWTVTSALFAGMFSDHTIHWLHKRGLLAWGERGKAEAIIAAVNDLIMRQG